MFDIGFWELLLIAVLGLVVLGPERLPQVARTLGLWVGKSRHYMRQLSVELDREVQSDALHRSIQASQQAISDVRFEMQAVMTESAATPANTSDLSSAESSDTASLQHSAKAFSEDR